MIVSCPHCSARFRVADEKLTAKKVSLRCARCRKVFPVTKIASTSAPVTTTDGYILIAHSDAVLLETIGDLLARNNIVYEVVGDGDTALAVMDRRPPRVAVVDVALPGLYAFEVVEKVRSRPGLESVKIILMSSVYNKMAYKCRPKSLYGADDYIEKHHLPDSLVPKIQQLCSNTVTVPASHPPEPREIPDDFDEVNESIRQAEEQEVTSTDQSQALDKARRLARIIVSDIALYNQQRVEEGIANGRFHEEFAKEIAEAKMVFSERISAEICSQEDFLMDAFAEFVEKRQQEFNC